MNVQFKVLWSEDIILGLKAKFLVIKSWLSKSGVRFMIWPIFEHFEPFGTNLQKRRMYNFDFSTLYTFVYYQEGTRYRSGRQAFLVL